MNDGNLKALSPSEAREYGRLGGIASGESRREKKRIRECLEVALAQPYFDLEGNEQTRADAIAAAMVNAAIGGDVQAAKFVRDSIDGLPIQRIEQAEISQETYARVARALGD